MSIGKILRDVKVVGNDSLVSVVAAKGNSCQSCAFLDLESTYCTFNNGKEVDGFNCIDKSLVWHVIEDKTFKFDLFKDIDGMPSFEDLLIDLVDCKKEIDRNKLFLDTNRTRFLLMKIIYIKLGNYLDHADKIVESDEYNQKFIVHSIEDAIECKKAFGDDYDMYCGYCSQWDLNETKVMPISKVDYLALSIKGNVCY